MPGTVAPVDIPAVQCIQPTRDPRSGSVAALRADRSVDHVKVARSIEVARRDDGSVPTPGAPAAVAAAGATADLRRARSAGAGGRSRPCPRPAPRAFAAGSAAPAAANASPSRTRCRPPLRSRHGSSPSGGPARRPRPAAPVGPRRRAARRRPRRPRGPARRTAGAAAPTAAGVAPRRSLVSIVSGQFQLRLARERPAAVQLVDHAACLAQVRLDLRPQRAEVGARLARGAGHRLSVGQDRVDPLQAVACVLQQRADLRQRHAHARLIGASHQRGFLRGGPAPTALAFRDDFNSVGMPGRPHRPTPSCLQR